MRILHVISSLEIGGAQRLLVDLLPLQTTIGKVDLLVYERVNNDFEKTIEQAGIRIMCLNECNFYNPCIAINLRKIFKKYDLVHAHLFPTIYWASLAARGLNVKLVYTEHSTSNSRRNKWYFRLIERFMYVRYDKIISISQQTQEALTSWLKQHDERFVVINNGIDTKKFASVKKSVNPKSLIMVSRFAPAKDQETVIRAMTLLDKDVTLYFVGDGDNKLHCEILARELNVTDRVKFLGSRSDVAELISSSYIGIQSSNWEGFGLTAVEIMACGKPIIASGVDGLKQIVEGAGLIFKKGDEKDLANRINLLLNNKDYYESISQKCEERASLFDIKVMDNKYKQIYNELT